MRKSQDKFVYYCAHKRCGAILCTSERPVLLFGKFKCDRCGQTTTWRPSGQRQSRPSPAPA